MKKQIALMTLCAMLIAAITIGCAKASGEAPFGTADNEILTYSRVDPQKTPLVIAKIGNFRIEDLIKSFEQEYPQMDYYNKTRHPRKKSAMI